MRGAGIGLLVVGIIVGLIAVANKYALHFIPTGSHYDLYIGIVGAVIAIIGLVMLAMGRSSAAS